jgi:hypothetical protein
MLTLQRAISAVLLVIVLGLAPVACAAMVSQPQSDSHPCCPKPGHPDSNPCAKTGCISNVPALRAAPADFGVDLPAVVGAAAAAPAASLTPEWTPEAGFLSSTSRVFLINHSLLI